MFGVCSQNMCTSVEIDNDLVLGLGFFFDGPELTIDEFAHDDELPEIPEIPSEKMEATIVVEDYEAKDFIRSPLVNGSSLKLVLPDGITIPFIFSPQGLVQAPAAATPATPKTPPAVATPVTPKTSPTPVTAKTPPAPPPPPPAPRAKTCKRKTKCTPTNSERRGKRCRVCGLPADRAPYKKYHPRTKKGRDIVFDKPDDRCTVPPEFRVPGYPLQQNAPHPIYDDSKFARVDHSGHLVRT